MIVQTLRLVEVTNMGLKPNVIIVLENKEVELADYIPIEKTFLGKYK